MINWDKKYFLPETTELREIVLLLQDACEKILLPNKIKFVCAINYLLFI